MFVKFTPYFILVISPDSCSSYLAETSSLILPEYNVVLSNYNILLYSYLC